MQIIANIRAFINRRHALKSEDLQKTNNIPILGPTISVMGIMFLAIQYENNWVWYKAVAIGVFAMGFNQAVVFLLSKHHLKIFGISIHLREDMVDAFREAVTLIAVDLPLCLMLKPPVTILIGFWSVLSVALAMEMYRLRQRLFIALLALSLSCFTLFLLHQISYVQILFHFVSGLCIVVVLSSMEYFWLLEAERRRVLQERETQLVAESETIYQNAVIGEHSRTISHELNNLMMVIDMSIANPEKVNVEPIRSSLRQINNINEMVLSDLKNKSSLRVANLHEFINDISSVFRKMVESSRSKWVFENVVDSAIPLYFEERRGALFLVIQNLVQNAIRELARGKTVDPEIKLAVVSHPKFFTIHVSDNGEGLPLEVQEYIRNRVGYIYGGLGHGIGLKCVVNECEKNKFRLDFSTGPDGTVFRVEVSTVH